MKKRVLQFVMLAVVLLTAGNVKAQSIPDVSEWSFSSSYVEINNERYYLDETHGLAEFLVYYSNTELANSYVGTFTVPSKVTRNAKEYTVVSMRMYNWSYDLENVTKVELPNTLVRLGEYALTYFRNVNEFDIPASVKYMSNRVVNRNEYTLKFHGTTPPELTGSLTSSSNYHVKVIVPATAFQAYKTADYIEDCCVVSDNIDTQTFSTGKVDNGELGYVVVANQLPEIVTYSDVNKLIIDEGTIDQTDWYQLRQMKNLVSLDLSGLSITEIPYEALRNCWQIETVLLPPTLEAIHGYAFFGTGIRELLLPASLRTIDGGYNFQDCKKLTSIAIPEGVKSLPNHCFYSCSSMHHVTLPSTLETMGNYCMENCDLYELTVPGALKNVPYAAFSANKNMATLTLEEGVEDIGDYAFYNCTNTLTTVTLPSTVRRIRSSAFYNNDGNSVLTSVSLNEGLEEIDYQAFSGNHKLTEITLPSSLIYCLDRPFYWCNGLTKIYTYALIPPTVRNYIPTGEVRNIELYVPQWSFQEYMTTPGWLEFQDHTIIDPNILPENIVINKDFEFVLKPEQMAEGYNPNIRMLANTERIDDGFGHQKYERGNLTISSRSKLNIKNFEMIVSPYAKYYSDDSRFYSNRNYNYDYAATTYNPNSLFVRGEMRAQNQTYHLQLYNDRWQFVCFPFDVKVSDIVPDDALTQWVIRRYDGAKRAAQEFDQTWVNLSGEDELQAGKGYVMKCYNNDSKYNNAPVTFTLHPMQASITSQQVFNAQDRNVALEENVSEFEQNRSWNLIGNPYPCYFDTRYIVTDSPFLVWDSYNRTYAAFSPVDDDYILEPGEAFFIQRPADSEGELTFLNAGRQTYRNPNDLTVSRLLMAGAKRTVINLTLTDGENSDRTRVVFNDAAKMKYETGRDAAKFMAESPETPQIWSQGGTVNYAINERPTADGIVQLAVRCGKAGTYTIGLSGQSGIDAVVLEDRAMGKSIELTDTESYTFTVGQAATLNGRFYLSPAMGTVTGINEVVADTDNTPAYNLNGQRVGTNQRGLIIKNGKKVMR